MNPTKSLCNPYVFNTAITRARSLVVAVGNPFTLLSVEANVAKPKHCWKEFIARCLEHHSFIIPDTVCDRPRDISAEIQHILVTQAVPACLNKELLPVSCNSHTLLLLYNSTVHFLSKTLLAIAPLLIQLAHFHDVVFGCACFLVIIQVEYGTRSSTKCQPRKKEGKGSVSLLHHK